MGYGLHGIAGEEFEVVFGEVLGVEESVGELALEGGLGYGGGAYVAEGGVFVEDFVLGTCGECGDDEEGEGDECCFHVAVCFFWLFCLLL